MPSRDDSRSFKRKPDIKKAAELFDLWDQQSSGSDQERMMSLDAYPRSSELATGFEPGLKFTFEPDVRTSQLDKA